MSSFPPPLDVVFTRGDVARRSRPPGMAVCCSGGVGKGTNRHSLPHDPGCYTPVVSDAVLTASQRATRQARSVLPVQKHDLPVDRPMGSTQIACFMAMTNVSSIALPSEPDGDPTSTTLTRTCEARGIEGRGPYRGIQAVSCFEYI